MPGSAERERVLEEWVQRGHHSGHRIDLRRRWDRFERRIEVSCTNTVIPTYIHTYIHACIYTFIHACMFISTSCAHNFLLFIFR